jgi:hypothetical protein
MSEEEQVVEVAEVEETEEAAGDESKSEQFKVKAEDLFETINKIIREGTVKRVTVMRNDRVLVDIPVVVGVAASVLLAVYMPVLSAIVAVGALFGGCTVRIERDEEPEEA